MISAKGSMDDGVEIHFLAHSQSRWQPLDLICETLQGLPYDVAAGFLKGYLRQKLWSFQSNLRIDL